MLESFTTDSFEYDKLSPEEQKRRGILGRLVGIIADTVRPTRNGRKYSAQLWEKVFEDPIMKERIENKCCFGELGHPTGREETDPEKIAICMDSVPKKGNDGNLHAVFNILDTPNGRILKTLCDYGCHIGISSRGSGDTFTDFDGQESVDPDTYHCECWDAVLMPGVKSARLQYVTESLDRTRYNKSLRTKLQESLDKASEDDKRVMNETLLELLGVDFSGSTDNESDYADEDDIEDIIDDDTQDEGLNINEKMISEQVMERADAIEKCSNLNKQFVKHFDKIYNDIDEKTIKHHGSEMQALFDQASKIKLSNTNKQLNAKQLYDWFITDGKLVSDLFDNETEAEVYGDFANSLLDSSKDVLDTLRDCELLNENYIDLTEHPLNIIVESNNDASRIDKDLRTSGYKLSKNLYEKYSYNITTFGNEQSISSAQLREKYSNIIDESLNEALIHPELANQDMTFIVNNAMSHQIDKLFGSRIKDKNVIEKNKIQYTIPYDSDLEQLARRNNYLAKQLYEDINEAQSSAVDNNEAIVEELQTSLKQQQLLESQLIELQEKLSVCYAKEATLEEEAKKYKKTISKLSEGIVKVRALEEKLSKFAKDKETLSEQLNASQEKIQKLEATARLSSSSRRSLKESNSTKLAEIAQLNENLKTLEMTSKTQVGSLNESIAKLQTELNSKKSEYSKKIGSANKLVEKYKRVAMEAVDKYINSQAIRLGVTSAEIKNRLPESYSFEDIDTACEDMQSYKLTMNKLPFRTNNLNENVQIKATTSKNESIIPASRHDDEVDDTLLELAGLK